MTPNPRGYPTDTTPRPSHAVRRLWHWSYDPRAERFQRKVNKAKARLSEAERWL